MGLDPRPQALKKRDNTMSLFMVVSQRMFPEDGVLSQPLGQHGGIPRKGRINL